jgi:hypothetical protein
MFIAAADLSVLYRAMNTAIIGAHIIADSGDLSEAMVFIFWQEGWTSAEPIFRLRIPPSMMNDEQHHLWYATAMQTRQVADRPRLR